MLVPTPVEYAEIKDDPEFHYISGIVFDGFSIEEYCNLTMTYLYRNRVPYVASYFCFMVALGVLGILDTTTKKDYIERYVNLFLIFYYGLVPVGLLNIFYYKIGKISEGRSKFIYFFYKSYGWYSIPYFYIVHCSVIVIVGMIVHIFFIWITEYLYYVMAVSVLLSILLIINSCRCFSMMDMIEERMISDLRRNRRNIV